MSLFVKQLKAKKIWGPWLKWWSICLARVEWYFSTTKITNKNWNLAGPNAQSQWPLKRGHYLGFLHWRQMKELDSGIFTEAFSHFFFFLVVVGIELRVLYLLGNCSTTWAIAIVNPHFSHLLQQIFPRHSYVCDTQRRFGCISEQKKYISSFWGPYIRLGRQILIANIITEHVI